MGLAQDLNRIQSNKKDSPLNLSMCQYLFQISQTKFSKFKSIILRQNQVDKSVPIFADTSPFYTLLRSKWQVI